MVLPVPGKMGKIKGPVAERLGRALQKLLQRFKSARDLKKDYNSVIPYVLESLVKVFDIWHLKEVLMVVAIHLIVHFKKFNFMEMIKEVFVHQILGIMLPLLALLFVTKSPVGVDGELVQQKL